MRLERVAALAAGGGGVAAGEEGGGDVGAVEVEGVCCCAHDGVVLVVRVGCCAGASACVCWSCWCLEFVCCWCLGFGCFPVWEDSISWYVCLGGLGGLDYLVGW